VATGVGRKLVCRRDKAPWEVSSLHRSILRMSPRIEDAIFDTRVSVTGAAAPAAGREKEDWWMEGENFKEEFFYNDFITIAT